MSSRWEPFDIAVLGTSLSAGWGWQPIVREKLQLLTPKNVIFHDFAHPGYTSADLLNNNANNAIRINSKKIIIEAGMNDVTGGISLNSFKANVQEMINLVIARNFTSNLYLMTMNPAISPAPSDLITNLPYYQQALRDLSDLNGTNLIDLTPLWGSPTNTQIPDGVHPTETAVRAVTVPAIYDVFKDLVNE